MFIAGNLCRRPPRAARTPTSSTPTLIACGSFVRCRERRASCFTLKSTKIHADGSVASGVLQGAEWSSCAWIKAKHESGAYYGTKTLLAWRASSSFSLNERVHSGLTFPISIFRTCIYWFYVIFSMPSTSHKLIGPL